MSPERVSGLVARWVRLYTKDLPAALADRRREEIASDLFEHVELERRRGTPDRTIALAVLSRMVRGMAADVAWRRHTDPSKGDLMKPLAALFVAAIGVAVLALVFDSPVLILLAIAAVVAVGVGAFALSARDALEGAFLVPLVVAHAVALGLTALGVAAIVVGERGDAPGLILFGVVLISCVVVGAITVSMRTFRRSSQ